MLSRSKQQFSSTQTKEEQASLNISKQLITDAGLTVPEFTNSLHSISNKGYLWHVVIFDDNVRSQMQDFIQGDQYDEVLRELQKHDTEETSNKLKQETLEQMKKMLPEGSEIDKEAMNKDFIKISEAFKEGIQGFKNMNPEEIAIIILMPFRDINKLLERMNSRESFEDIKDDGFWYDKDKFEFHIDSTVINTSYQNKPNLEHYILSEFYNASKTSSVDYEELSTFDVAKGQEAYRDSMRRFVNKHPFLPKIFTVHKYKTEFHPEQY